MDPSPDRPVPRSRRFANALLVVPALYGAGLAALGVWKYCTGTANSAASAGAQVAGGLVVAAAFLAARRLGTSAKARLMAVTLSTGLSLLLAECSLAYLQRPAVYATQEGAATYRAAAARQLGQEFDQRTKREVVEALRSEGVAAVPAFHPEYFYLKGSSLRIGNEDVIPLGGVADARTVFCNESGQYLVYDSDEHGFNNPKGLYAPGKIDIVAVGDSFAQGACVCSNTNLVSCLREKYPGAVNLGNAGDGPLCELATLAEYGQPLRPHRVVWCYYEGNDLLDLSREKKSVLLRYLKEPGYSAGLMSLQADVDRELRRIVEGELAKPPTSADSEAPPAPDFAFALSNVLTLGHVRGGIAAMLRSANPMAFPQSEEIPLLKQVLQAARERTEAGGGRLYFVYLPAYERYGTRGYSDKPYMRVKEVVAELGLPFVDVRQVFDCHDDVRGLFPLRVWGHYNEAGYRLAAETILQAIDRASSTAR
jgi:hypothetical protein